jgi:hypothetical protein
MTTEMLGKARAAAAEKEHSTMFPEPIAGRSKTGTHALKPSRSQLRSPGPI